MKLKKAKIVIITSTKGSLLKELLNENIKNRIFEVVSDRNCEAIKFAKSQNIKTVVYKEKNRKKFSNYLYKRYKTKKIDFYLTFFTKIIEGKFLNLGKNKIVNSHPALLPKFKGLNAFEDNFFSKNRYYGATIHFINNGVDSGPIISKIKILKNKKYNFKRSRHNVFMLHKNMILQFIKNFETKKIKVIKKDVFIYNKNKKEKYSNKIDKQLNNYFN